MAKTTKTEVRDAEVVAEKQTTAMTPATSDPRPVAKTWATTDDVHLSEMGAGQGLCTFETHTAAGLMHKERHDCDLADNGMDHVNTVLNIVDASVGRCTFEGKDGEVISTVRLCLELDDGRLINLFSEPAYRTFATRMRTHNAMAFEAGKPCLSKANPLILKLTRVPLKNDASRSMYRLDRPV